jgi:hypothetical protein
LACAGCDIVLGLDRRDTVKCTTPVIDDKFDMGEPCAPWGGATRSSARLETVGGELVLTPDVNARGAGGCTYNGVAAFGTGGVALEVTRVWSVASGYIAFEAFPEDTADVTAKLIFKNSGIGVYTTEPNPIAIRTYDAATMRWWRLRPVEGGVAAEVSGDDGDYTTIAIVPGTPPDRFKANFIGGVEPEPAPGSIAFGAVRVCPLTE